jgi:hypothetical protein
MKPFKTKEDARRAVFDYIETFYYRSDCTALLAVRRLTMRIN